MKNIKILIRINLVSTRIIYDYIFTLFTFYFKILFTLLLNRITGRTSKSDNISATIDPSVINTYFQNVNTDSQYIPLRLLTIPQETRIPKIDIQTVKSFMMKQKRTSPGPDGLPYWLWKNMQITLLRY